MVIRRTWSFEEMSYTKMVTWTTEIVDKKGGLDRGRLLTGFGS
jgi:hypothetical protein